MQPQALIIRTAGTNCDRELSHAFELAGAKAVTVHLNNLIEQPQIIQQANLIGFPGGFSYGDDIAAGRIFANRLRHRLYQPLLEAVGRSVPMIGVCNGFQVLVKLGLLPNPHAEPGQPQAATLADNIHGRFIDRWVPIRITQDTRCIWTQNLDSIDLPIAHAQGRFVLGSKQVLAQLQQQGQIAMRYSSGIDAGSILDGGNPNGSVDDIAGVCDPTGLILGLMPHPERYTHQTHHPAWTSHATPDGLPPSPAGLLMFQNAVRYAANAMVQDLSHQAV